MQAADELYHSQDEGLSASKSSSVSHRTGSLVVEQSDSQIPNVKEIPRHCSESEQIGILLERQREQILAVCRGEIRKHEFQADHDRIQKLNDRVSKRRNFRVHQGDERLQRDQQLLHELLFEQNWDFREAHEKSFNEMEELKRFQGSTFDAFARRKLVEIETQTLNSQASSKCN